MVDEVWDIEINVDDLTLDDMEILEAGLGPGASASQIKRVLASMITNKTPEWVGQIKRKDIPDLVRAINDKIEDLALPKESDTP